MPCLQPPRHAGNTGCRSQTCSLLAFNPRDTRGIRGEESAPHEPVPSTPATRGEYGAGRQEARRRHLQPPRHAGNTALLTPLIVNDAFNPRDTRGIPDRSGRHSGRIPSTPATRGEYGGRVINYTDPSLQPPRHAGNTLLVETGLWAVAFNPRDTRGIPFNYLFDFRRITWNPSRLTIDRSGLP